MYDLIVIGSGPAGASAAITAARAGASVLLLERARFPRQKVCGEFVSAESLDLLCWLLESERSEVVKGAHRLHQARICIDGIAVTCPVDPPAASIARFDLDLALWEAARSSGVEAREQVTVKAVEGSQPFTVSTSDGAFESRAVVNASGRWSNLTAAAVQGGNKPQHKWLGVKAHFLETGPPPAVDLYFFNGGYCGVQPVGPRLETKETRINVCAMVRADVASTLNEVLEQDLNLKERSRNWQPLMEPVTTSPLIFREPRPVEGRVLFAGDAAGFVDPFVGGGISLAVRSGNLSAKLLMPFFANRISLDEAAASYRQAYKRDLSPIFHLSAKLRYLFFRLPRVVRVKFLTGLRANPAIVRYLVRHTR